MIRKRKIFEILARYKDSQQAIVVTGMRRVGKTFVMQYLYETIKSKNKIFLDLESPVNQKIFQDDNYENVKRALARQGVDFSTKAYVFLDEIQNIKRLPSIVKYLYDHNQIKFYLTGSSSFYLKNLFSESMAGRKFIFELFPLTFEEFLWFKDQKISLEADYDFLSGLYEEYLEFGGFPQVVLEASPEKKLREIDDVLGSYFQLDVKALANLRDNKNLKSLLFLLSNRVGSKPEVSKLADSLGVSRPTVYEYLEFFKQTYFIHYLRPFSGSTDVQIRVLPKVYFCDTGVLNRLGKVSKAVLFENKIFNQLNTMLAYDGGRHPLKERLNYHQTKGGSEIDFIVDSKLAYEVKLSASRYDLVKLKRRAEKIGIKDYKVVSLEKAKRERPGIIYSFAI